MNEKYMRAAIDLAKKGKGRVSPNPLVGAVIVKNSKIIGQGYHEEYGQNHAEINAIKSAKEDLKGSTMYITLEPCCHYGNTPPCVDEIIKSKISKIVIGHLDPNPIVSGNGVKKLIHNNIEVVIDVLRDECMKMNEVFLKYISNKEPFVIMKNAMSLDGKIATYAGESKWISSQKSREKVHELRSQVSAIMVGVDTIIKDNPSLTCRLIKGKNPIRIIVDSSLRIPINSIVLKDNCSKTIIATTNNSNKGKIEKLRSEGIDVLVIDKKDNKVDLKKLMKVLGRLNIDSVLLEGGSTLNFSALKEDIVDKVQIYIAPIILGGRLAKTPVGGDGVKYLSDAYNLKNITAKVIDRDILVEGYIRRKEA
ncbi:bifunctional diaminohydroxyphosphoribosylaminopyrimidine deaminase/5-amino-6-(5-phosphoribosylamino)uracil reductase RibD [Romboutsia lituseburensis]|uniref:bifunctional diaminohydroxyphosphoribosylaminopyrimidine deaminase/5-amino-6-(5-phosphoribosylamino)uracil reductase RibD n=1 Tax=Romboutsia lituseburensis TaxID=1537 RepID=UPI0022EAE018|nr:bifunctional diaminohydroxyphosphoribosylaminopyrimidine deaminase/5-amino-6-(5-phosphoribosylamino)uracil reductase RibD [Romboutsia lituseburensis]